MRYVYLHGFASSGRSRKAQAFRKALADRGVELAVHDLAEGDFDHLTISGQLRVTESVLDGAPCRLIGSSMGGYLAAIYAAAHPETDRLVLLAPAFGFAPRWREMQGPDVIEQWAKSGWLEVFHYGDQALHRIHYGLFENALNFPPEPDFRQPALIFHGRKDTVVPISLSRAFAASHPSVELHELESDHELLDVLDAITNDAVPYLLSQS
jgi:uncharacterized protein